MPHAITMPLNHCPMSLIQKNKIKIRGIVWHKFGQLKTNSGRIAFKFFAHGNPRAGQIHEAESEARNKGRWKTLDRTQDAAICLNAKREKRVGRSSANLVCGFDIQRGISGTEWRSE